LAKREEAVDRSHSVRMVVGNGLKLDIWEKFTQRFGIKLVCEFYGATEGNCSVANYGGRVGSVGFIPTLLPSILFPLCLVKVDKDTKEPVRDSDGLCVVCQTGEPGELVGKITRGHPVRDFNGYADKSATSKKVMMDVWKKGDKFFRTGDIFVMDDLGWLYFKDRAGDTFRWKGENVSTTEVEAIVSSILGLRDVVVYGVEIPGTDGRAGMAAIPDPDRTVDLKQLYDRVETMLPAYARPQFVRIVDKIDMTATQRLKKRDLQQQGFDPSILKDPLYFRDGKMKNYVILGQEQFLKICSGHIRF